MYLLEVLKQIVSDKKIDSLAIFVDMDGVIADYRFGEGENSLWQIFSVYIIETESYYITTNFNNDSDYLEFLETMKNRSKYDFNTELSSNDRIITLSTCYDDDRKTVVHAKLIKRELR